jgi:myb proto-oncogene protein
MCWGTVVAKFSADEERLVLELQAQFGNKWARIANYLPGRMDNFWSTRQKRLARLLHAPLPGPSSRSTRAVGCIFDASEATTFSRSIITWPLVTLISVTNKF